MFSSPREASTGLEARFKLLCFHYRNVPHNAMAAKTTPMGSAMHMDLHFKIPMKLPINPTHGVLVLSIKTCPRWTNHTEWQLQLNLLLLMSVIMNNNIGLYVFQPYPLFFFIILYTCIVKYYLNDKILQRVVRCYCEVSTCKSNVVNLVNCALFTCMAPLPGCLFSFLTGR